MTGHRRFWDEFVEFKNSEGQARMIKNQENAKQKQYHHHLGSGGYRTAIPLWQKLEQEILDRGHQMIAGAPIQLAEGICIWQESIQPCSPQQTWNANVHAKQMVHRSMWQKSR